MNVRWWGTIVGKCSALDDDVVWMATGISPNRRWRRIWKIEEERERGAERGNYTRPSRLKQNNNNLIQQFISRRHTYTYTFSDLRHRIFTLHLRLLLLNLNPFVLPRDSPTILFGRTCIFYFSRSHTPRDGPRRGGQWSRDRDRLGQWLVTTSPLLWWDEPVARKFIQFICGGGDDVFSVIYRNL